MAKGKGLDTPASKPEQPKTFRATLKRDEHGEWVLPAQQAPGGVETYVKGVPEDYAGQEVLLKPKGLSYEFLRRVEKTNGDHPTATVDAPTTGTINAPLPEKEQEAGQKSESQLKAETARLMIGRARHDMTELDPLIQNMGSLPKEQRQRVVPRLKYIESFLTAVEPELHQLPNEEQTAHARLLLRVRGFLMQLDTSEQSKKAASEKPGKEKPVKQKNEPLVDIEQWKRVLAAQSAEEFPKSAPPTKVKFSTDKTPWNPGTGRFKNLEPVPELKGTDPGARGGTLYKGSEERIGAGNPGKQGTQHSMSREQSGPAEGIEDAQGQAGADKGRKPPRPPKPGTEGAPSDVPEETQARYQGMEWEEFLGTIPEPLVEPIEKYVNALGEFYAIEILEKRESERVKNAGTTRTTAYRALQEAAEKARLKPPSDEATNRMRLEANFIAAGLLVEKLRSAYAASLDGQSEAPQMIRAARRALQLGRGKFISDFPSQESGTPRVDQVEARVRGETREDQEKEVLTNLRKSLKADAALLDDSGAVPLKALRADAESKIFRITRWYKTKQGDPREDRERAASLVSDVIADVSGKGKRQDRSTPNTIESARTDAANSESAIAALALQIEKSRLENWDLHKARYADVENALKARGVEPFTAESTAAFQQRDREIAIEQIAKQTPARRAQKDRKIEIPKIESTVRAFVVFDEKTKQWLESGEGGEVVLGPAPKDLPRGGGLARITKVLKTYPGQKQTSIERYFADPKEISREASRTARPPEPDKEVDPATKRINAVAMRKADLLGALAEIEAIVRELGGEAAANRLQASEQWSAAQTANKETGGLHALIKALAEVKTAAVQALKEPATQKGEPQKPIGTDTDRALQMSGLIGDIDGIIAQRGKGTAPAQSSTTEPAKVTPSPLDNLAGPDAKTPTLSAVPLLETLLAEGRGVNLVGKRFRAVVAENPSREGMFVIANGAFQNYMVWGNPPPGTTNGSEVVLTQTEKKDPAHGILLQLEFATETSGEGSKAAAVEPQRAGTASSGEAATKGGTVETGPTPLKTGAQSSTALDNLAGPDATVDQEPAMDQVHRETSSSNVSALSVVKEGLLGSRKNEDTSFQLPQQRAFGVFDGIGGHADGERAAELARDSIAEILGHLPTLSLKQTRDAVKDALVNANQTVAQENQGKDKKDRMGTTASVVKIWIGQSGEQHAIIGNVGDSRVGILRATGKFEPITLDDATFPGAATDEDAKRSVLRKLSAIKTHEDVDALSPDELSAWINRNVIAQYIGGEKIEPHMYVVKVFPGDRVVLTTDGVHDNLADDEIEKILRATPDDATQATELLIHAAQQRSRDDDHPRNKADDMTAIVVKIEDYQQVQRTAQEPAAAGTVETQPGTGAQEQPPLETAAAALKAHPRAMVAISTLLNEKLPSPAELPSLNPNALLAEIGKQYGSASALGQDLRDVIRSRVSVKNAAGDSENVVKLKREQYDGAVAEVLPALKLLIESNAEMVAKEKVIAVYQKELAGKLLPIVQQDTVRYGKFDDATKRIAAERHAARNLRKLRVFLAQEAKQTV